MTLPRWKIDTDVGRHSGNVVGGPEFARESSPRWFAGLVGRVFGWVLGLTMAAVLAKLVWLAWVWILS